MNMAGPLERIVKLEHSIYYKYAESTLKSLNNDPNRLLSLYGATEKKTYHGELASLSPFYSNYSQGKMPTQKELDEYNKTKNTNYSMYQIKTRLWKLFKYEESKGNLDYYVKPRRVELLPQMNRLWKDEKTNERVR